MSDLSLCKGGYYINQLDVWSGYAMNVGMSSASENAKSDCICSGGISHPFANAATSGIARSTGSLLIAATASAGATSGSGVTGHCTAGTDMGAGAGAGGGA